MAHGFTRLFDPERRDDVHGLYKLGPDDAVLIGFVSDAPSSAPSEVGRQIDDWIEEALKAFNWQKGSVGPLVVRNIIASVCMKIQHKLKTLGKPYAVTDLVITACYENKLYFYIAGDAFFLCLRGAPERPQMMHFSATEVWNNREPITYSPTQEVSRTKIREKKYLGEDPLVNLIPSDIPELVIEEGDWFLLASDGLAAHVQVSELLTHYQNAKNPEQLIEAIQANLPEKLDDDVSCVVLAPKVTDSFSTAKKQLEQWEAENFKRLSEIRNELEDLLVRTSYEQELLKKDLTKSVERKIEIERDAFSSKLQTLTYEMNSLYRKLDSLEKNSVHQIEELSGRIRVVDQKINATAKVQAGMQNELRTISGRVESTAVDDRHRSWDNVHTGPQEGVEKSHYPEIQVRHPARDAHSGRSSLLRHLLRRKLFYVISFLVIGLIAALIFVVHRMFERSENVSSPPVKTDRSQLKNETDSFYWPLIILTNSQKAVFRLTSESENPINESLRLGESVYFAAFLVRRPAWETFRQSCTDHPCCLKEIVPGSDLSDEEKIWVARLLNPEDQDLCRKGKDYFRFSLENWPKNEKRALYLHLLSGTERQRTIDEYGVPQSFVSEETKILSRRSKLAVELSQLNSELKDIGLVLPVPLISDVPDWKQVKGTENWIKRVRSKIGNWAVRESDREHP